MSGHSKWATIKRKKAATDSKRGKLFTKLLKEIQVAARVGGGSVDNNARLKTAVLAAKSLSVPGDNIDRAIKRGSGDTEGQNFEEILYEGYGPGGVALLIKALTDNKNRTVSEVRNALTRCNGSLAGSNAVSFLFNEKGVFSLPKSAVSEEKLFEAALDAGAQDIKDEGETWEIYCDAADFGSLRNVLEKVSEELEGAIRFIPVTTVRINGGDAQNMIKLLDLLDDLDDVQDVTANFEMDDKEMESLSA